jgi:hypothetical protein
MITRCGALERSGTYAVVVDHPRYELWVRDGVRTPDGRCHVETQQLTAASDPKSP